MKKTYKLPIGKDLLMRLFVIMTVFNSFWLSVMQKLPFSNVIAPMLVACIVVGVVFAQGKNIKLIEVMIYIIICIVVLGDIMFRQYDVFSEYAPYFLGGVASMIFAGVILDCQRYHGFMFKVSVIYILVLFIYVFFVFTHTNTIMAQYIDYMGFAYYSLPAELIILYEFLRSKKIVPLIASCVGIFYLVMCGTRGPILCVIIFVLYCFFLNIKKFTGAQKIMILLLFLFAVVFLFNIQTIANWLIPIFEEKHLSTRILLFFVRDNSGIFDGSGRVKLYKDMWELANQSPICGMGMMGEQRGYSVAYAHNLFLELLIAFGLPVGMILIICITCLIIIAILKTKSDIEKYYLGIFMSGTIVKLMLSSTYLREPLFFILIGYCISVIRKNRQVIKK